MPVTSFSAAVLPRLRLCVCLLNVDPLELQNRALSGACGEKKFFLLHVYVIYTCS